MQENSLLTDTEINKALAQQNIEHSVISRGLEKFKLPSGQELAVATVDMPWPPYDPNLVFILGDEVTLVDVGPPMYSAFADLVRAMDLLDPQYQVYDRLKSIVITHAHFDHWGSLQSLVDRLMEGRTEPISVYCHAYDSDVVVPTEASMHQDQSSQMDFSLSAGLGTGSPFHHHHPHHGTSPETFELITPEEGDTVSGYEIIHLPGHSPGCIGVRVDNVVIAGDAILYKETPNTSSEMFHEYSGLAHMIASYYRLAKIGKQAPIAIGGHGKIIPNLRKKAMENLEFHSDRLAKIYHTARNARTDEMTGWQIADAYFSGNGRPLEGFSQYMGTVETVSHLEVGCRIGLFSVRTESQNGAMVHLYRAIPVSDVRSTIDSGFEGYRSGI
ncbi:MAG: MBL fold metallo-hydrolase [Desulfobacterales bacterium]